MEKIKNFLFKNTSTKQTIAKNTVWLFLGEILGRLLKLGVLVFATRILGVEGWGLFSYALAFVSIFYTFSDIGINTFITRELSTNDTDKYKYLSASLILKMGLLILSLIASLIFIPHFATITLGIKIILALAFLNFSDSLREFALSINRAMQKMEREAYIKVIMNGTITVLGILLLLLRANPLSLAIAYSVGSIAATIITVWMVSSELRHVTWKFSFSTIKTVADFAWPFIAVTLFMAIIANVDTIMLGQVKSATEVGYYAAAERIVQFLAIIPIFIGISTFPLMSKSEGDAEASTRIFEKVMLMVIIIGLPISIGGVLLCVPLISVIFGAAYAPGAVVLGILMVSILADFPNIILSNAIFAKNLQKKFVIATALGVIVNVLMNFYLIPRYGAVGAAFSTTVSQLSIMTANWLMFKRFLSFSIISKSGKILVATIAMVIVIILCTIIHTYVILTIFIAMGAYLGILYALRELSLMEVLSLLKNR